jgi:hypothetical protein
MEIQMQTSDSMHVKLKTGCLVGSIERDSEEALLKTRGDSRVHNRLCNFFTD